MARLIDGKEIAESIYENINLRARELRGRGVIPKLAVVLVGDNPASRLYVNSKEKRARENGIETEEHHLDGSVAEAQVTELIKKLNVDDTVHGILVQLPLPEHMDKLRVLSCISPGKDVDGLHAVNAGALMTGNRGFIPCTPKGILHLVKSTGIDIAGKRCAVIGRSSLVGKPAQQRCNCDSMPLQNGEPGQHHQRGGYTHMRRGQAKAYHGRDGKARGRSDRRRTE